MAHLHARPSRSGAVVIPALRAITLPRAKHLPPLDLTVKQARALWLMRAQHPAPWDDARQAEPICVTTRYALERRGLITASWEKDHRGKGRLVLRLTAQGQTRAQQLRDAQKGAGT